MCFGGEVYNYYFIYFEYYSTPPLLVKSFINNYLNTFLVTPRRWPGYPRGEVIHESNHSAVAVDLSLHEVCVEEKEQD
jgi:hypothetical protein